MQKICNSINLEEWTVLGHSFLSDLMGFVGISGHLVVFKCQAYKQIHEVISTTF